MDNLGLVKHAQMALDQKFGYVWGTFGQVLTPTLFQQKLNQYPGGVGNYKTFIQQNWLNRRTVDCVGLIKSYMWWNGGNIKYNSKQDTNANGMYNLAKKKGPISTIPEVPGVCVWHNGHIGVYIGNGWVIESKGTKYGVVKSPLKGSGAGRWTHWLEVPFIEYKEIIKEEPKKEVGLLAWQKELGERAIDNLTKEGLLNNPDSWKGQLGDNTPMWLFWEMMDRLLKEVKK